MMNETKFFCLDRLKGLSRRLRYNFTSVQVFILHTLLCHIQSFKVVCNTFIIFKIVLDVFFSVFKGEELKRKFSHKSYTDDLKSFDIVNWV